MKSCLRISINSRSDWLKSEAEHNQHCYQRIKTASACLCLHKCSIFQIFTASSSRQLNILSFVSQNAKVWTKCAKCMLFELNNTALNL